MFFTHVSRAIRAFGCVGTILVLAALPSIAWSQSTAPRAGATPQATARSGFVNSVTGIVLIRKADGTQVPAKSGDLIERGTILSTGGSGEVVVLFPDGQHVTLNADSILRVEEYQFDPRNINASRATFALLEGMMRIVTGAINAANPDALRITAGDAVISIRSKDATSFVVEADTKVARETGSVAVIVGEVSVLRPNKTSVRVATDQFTRWQPAVSPEQPLPLGAAPAHLQAMASVGAAPLARQTPQATTGSGIVNSVSGVVLVRDANGAEAPAKPGDAIGRGTVVSTGATGEAVLLFPDGQHLTLNSDSVLRIDEYRFDPADIRSSRTSIGLAAGMMRIVTGAINAANPDALRIMAGGGMISVRSPEVTSFVVEADKFVRETGSVAVIVGEVSIVRPDKTTIRVDTNHYTRWQPRVSPEQPQPVAAAPAYLQAMAAAPADLQNVPADVEAATQLALATLPAPGAGPEDPAQPQATTSVFLPPVTPGGAGGCVGSPC